MKNVIKRTVALMMMMVFTLGVISSCGSSRGNKKSSPRGGDDTPDAAIVIFDRNLA